MLLSLFLTFVAGVIVGILLPDKKYKSEKGPE